MRRSHTILALFLALLTVGTAARAADDSQDKDLVTITADYVLNDIAFENKDVDTLVAFLTDDFTGVDETGKVVCHSRAEQREIFQKILPAMDKITAHTVVGNIQFSKDTATVTDTNDYVLTLVQDGQTHTFTDTSTSQDVWVKSGGTWLMKTSTTTVARHAIDGKPSG